MDDLLPIAAKSFIVAGAALLILRLARRRSAAERSWIAHLGLAAVLMLPLAALLLPRLHIETPALVTKSPAPNAASPAVQAAPAAPEAATPAATFPEAAASSLLPGIDWFFWLYAAPAGLLVLLTLIALARLFTLRARANVLVEPHWLTALARAQHRMGFKHGTALLTSDDLPSPISWGVMRPVILLNSEAANSHREAEAIIAHELAHVASLDWAKLLLSRLTIALFWFNPFVWLLAREAHQLREEAADDAVLGANIVDTDYAQLLVGVARHECRGLLIGAHGVAPAKNSLSRRVRRVLDSGSVRGPAGRAFTLGMFTGAVALAAPLAALTLGPAEEIDTSKAYYASVAATPQPTVQAAAPASVTQSAGIAAGAAAIVATHTPAETVTARKQERDDEREGSIDEDIDVDVDVDVDVDAKGFSGDQVRVAVATAAAGQHRPVLPRPRSATDREIDQIISARVHGVDAAYISQMRAASPRLRQVTIDKLIALKIHGVTPSYVRELTAAGYPNLDPDQIVNAAIQGVSPGYVRSMGQAGVPRMAFDQLVEMKVLGVSPDYVRKLRAAGFRNLTTSQIMNMRVHGVDPEDLRAARDSP